MIPQAAECQALPAPFGLDVHLEANRKLSVAFPGLPCDDFRAVPAVIVQEGVAGGRHPFVTKYIDAQKYRAKIFGYEFLCRGVQKVRSVTIGT